MTIAGIALKQLKRAVPTPGTSTKLWLDLAVLAAGTAAGITASSLLLPRLAR